MAKDKKEFFNRFFVVIAISNFVLLFALFSFLNRQLVGVKQESVLAKEDNVFSAEQAAISEVSDPFITPGPGAEKVLFKPIIDGQDSEIGPVDAKLTIVEFSDFSCKFCAEQDKIVKEIFDKYPGKVRLIWKDFPEANVDSSSYQASLAARCAKDQNKFWEFHDLLFANSDNALSLLDIAVKAGLDVASFKDCFSQKKFASDINTNLKEAGALRLPGTPFFFINDQEYLGAIDKEALEKILNEQ